MIDYARVEHLVRQAGQMILDANITREQIHTKESRDNFVTDYDIRIQQYLVDNLRILLPEAGFFCEETMQDSESRDIRKGFCFYIDPIDGTTNFIYGYHFSCVSVGIALDGRMIAGFVYNPYNNEMYRAIRGQGAYLNDRRLWTENRTLADGILAFGAPADTTKGETFFKMLYQLYEVTQTIRNGGSAALDLCRVASGSNTAFIQTRLSPYDYAAASVIIEEAGGVITQLDGSPVSLEENCLVIAGAPVAYVQTRNIALRMLDKK
ncbi:MAG: inositol monophosphatase [Clostridia bacterium]|nr:inositol monophosphatase [Clostridia bacterium]